MPPSLSDVSQNLTDHTKGMFTVWDLLQACRWPLYKRQHVADYLQNEAATTARPMSVLAQSQHSNYMALDKCSMPMESSMMHCLLWPL